MTSETQTANESSVNRLRLNISQRFARLFRCDFGDATYGDTEPGILAVWSVAICAAPRLGRFVLFSEERSLFTIVISAGYGRSLARVLEQFQWRREELACELGISELAPVSISTLHFGKRVNRHIIGSQNDLIRLLLYDLENVAPPLEARLLRKFEGSLNQSPMSYLRMDSPRFALFGYDDYSSPV
jgi:hypothetical protein